MRISDWSSDVCSSDLVKASLAARSTDVAVLKLTIGGRASPYNENLSGEFNDFLESIAAKLPIDLPGNVQLIPDLRIVVGHDMYLVKPTALRHWLRSPALADAEQLAAALATISAHPFKAGAVRAAG